MKKQKIKVDGIKYKYIITENNTIRIDGVIPYEISEKIKARLIKKGIWKPEVEEIDHNIDSKTRFEKWCNIELKELIKENHPLGKAAREELERRGVSYE